MPFAAALPALGGIASSLIGGLAGASNPRPPSLSPVQSKALNSLIPSLQQGAQAPAGIDPVQQAGLYNNIAQSLTGANNQVTNALVSRGLGHSGILGTALMQNANQAQAAQNQANLGLQQQGIQRQQFDINALLQAIGVNNTPGQSTGGAFLAGMAPIAAYSIQNMMNNRNNGFGGGGGNGGGGGGDFGGGWG